MIRAITSLLRKIVGEGSDIDPLTRLAIKHGTDKWGPHFYTPIYHTLFRHLRKRPVRLLEIGTGGYHLAAVGGASLAMWCEYFSKGQIVGIDIAEKSLQLDPRITLLRGSQTDTAFLAGVCDAHGPFDIVIDDGSHIPKDSAVSFHALFPRMADAGLYVIEDVQTWFWPKYGGSLRADQPASPLLRSLFEYLNHAEISVAEPAAIFGEIATQVRSVRAYHNLLVVEKGDNTAPSNFAYQFDNPHVARALHTIERELAREPTADGFANLIAMYTFGRRFAAAHALCGEALARWPAHPGVMAVGIYNADACDDPAAKRGYLEALALHDPGDADIKALLEWARGRLSA